MNYLVTGGCGFIGSHLVEALLAEGHGVVVLDDLSTGKRENLPAGAPLVVGDVADAELVRRLMAEADGCFHLAAIASVARSNEDWLGTHRTNQTGSVTVFDAARAGRGGKPVPVVYASSAAVYGAPEIELDGAGIGEDTPCHPLSAYGADKYGSELHGEVASRIHGVATMGLRFFNVYGPRQDPASPYSGVISIFAGRLAAGRGLIVFGDGEQTRDFIYVADVVAHLLAAMRTQEEAAGPKARVFNVCTGRSTSLRHLAELLGRLLGRPPAIEHQAARAGDIRHSLGQNGAARRELGLSARVGIEEGLRRLIDSLSPVAGDRP